MTKLTRYALFAGIITVACHGFSLMPVAVGQHAAPIAAVGTGPLPTSPVSPKPVKTWDRKPRTANEARIEEALKANTEVSFTDNPLEEALNYLEDLQHIEIVIDKQGLESEGVPSDVQVTLVMSGITLRSTLDLMLEPLGLDYVIKNEVLMVTSRSKADLTREVRVYDISRLSGVTATELEEIVRSTVAPESWAGLAAVPNSPEASCNRIRSTSKSLVVRQTQRVHFEINDLLNQLDSLPTDPVTKPVSLTPTSAASR